LHLIYGLNIYFAVHPFLLFHAMVACSYTRTYLVDASDVIPCGNYFVLGDGVQTSNNIAKKPSNAQAAQRVGAIASSSRRLSRCFMLPNAPSLAHRRGPVDGHVGQCVALQRGAMKIVSGGN
jgi:hypothetical protein